MSGGFRLSAFDFPSQLAARLEKLTGGGPGFPFYLTNQIRDN